MRRPNLLKDELLSTLAAVLHRPTVDTNMASIIQTQSSLQATCGTRTPAEREQATACDQPVSEVSSDDGNLAAQTFGSIEMGVVDPDEVMLRRIRADTSTGKTDLMPGVFTSEQGGYFEFEAIRKVQGKLTVHAS